MPATTSGTAQQSARRTLHTADYERGVKWQDCGGRARRSIRYGASPASALYLRDDRRSARGGIPRESACPIPAGPAVPPPRGSTRAQPSWTARQTHRHADADRRYLADYRPPRPRPASPRRAHRPPLRTILLRRCPRPPRTDPDPVLPGSGGRWAIGVYLASSGQFTESELPASFGPAAGIRNEKSMPPLFLRAFRNRLLTALIRRRRSRARKCEHEVFPG